MSVWTSARKCMKSGETIGAPTDGVGHDDSVCVKRERESKEAVRE